MLASGPGGLVRELNICRELDVGQRNAAELLRDGSHQKQAFF